MRARASAGAWRSTSASHAPFWSSIMAARLPRGAARPCAAKYVAGISRASLPSVSSPSELARRRAGSMVITTARRPPSAPQSAIEAATVVFPTPPLPAEMTIRCRSTSSRSVTTTSSAGAPRPRRAPPSRPPAGARPAPAPRARTPPRRGTGARPAARRRCRRAGAPVAQQLGDLRRLALHQTGAEGLARRLRHAEILEAVAGRGRVHHERVPRRPPALPARRLVPDLPDRHQLLQPGRGGDEVLVDLALEDGREQALHRDDEAQVLLERGAPVDVEHVEVRVRLPTEQGRESPSRLHLDRQRAPPAAREREGERRRDGRLPHPALADDDVQPPLEERGRHGARRRRRAGRRAPRSCRRSRRSWRAPPRPARGAPCAARSRGRTPGRAPRG